MKSVPRFIKPVKPEVLGVSFKIFKKPRKEHSRKCSKNLKISWKNLCVNSIILNRMLLFLRIHGCSIGVLSRWRPCWHTALGFFNNFRKLNEDSKWKPLPKVAPTAHFIHKIVHFPSEVVVLWLKVCQACAVRKLMRDCVTVVPKMLVSCDLWVTMNSSSSFFRFASVLIKAMIYSKSSDLMFEPEPWPWYWWAVSRILRWFCLVRLNSSWLFNKTWKLMLMSLYCWSKLYSNKSVFSMWSTSIVKWFKSLARFVLVCGTLRGT